MTLIDTHAHLYWDSYKQDLDEVIKRSLDVGISTIINAGVDVEKSKEALQVSKKLALNGIEGYSTIGIHPEEAKKYESSEILQKEIEELEQIYLSDPAKVIAVGECGLDFLSGYRNLQRKLFQAQIDLAKKLKLPLVVHCRDAWDETLEMIGNHSAILHCYSGLIHTTNYILHAANLTVSFTANITYPKNEYLREAVRALPLEKIILETDSPFLAPQSKRGQRNEPSAVKEIAELVASLKGISLEEVTHQTTTNAVSLLSLNK